MKVLSRGLITRIRVIVYHHKICCSSDEYVGERRNASRISSRRFSAIIICLLDYLLTHHIYHVYDRVHDQIFVYNHLNHHEFDQLFDD